VAKQKSAKNAMQRVPGKAGLVVGGGAVLGWGLGQIAYAWRLRRSGLIAEGTVVDNVRLEDSEFGPRWAPVIAFTDTTGNRVEFTPPSHGPGMGMTTGSTVEVIYLPDAPQRAQVNAWSHLLFPGLVACVGGVGFLVFVAFLILILPALSR
jgi:hypothetical protein